MSLHTKHVTDCCSAHIRCWHDCEGVTEAQCRDCGVDTCSGCAAYFDQDAGDEPDSVVTTARCKDCQEAKVVFEALTGKKWGAEAAVAFYAGVRS